MEFCTPAAGLCEQDGNKLRSARIFDQKTVQHSDHASIRKGALISDLLLMDIRKDPCSIMPSDEHPARVLRQGVLLLDHVGYSSENLSHCAEPTSKKRSEVLGRDHCDTGSIILVGYPLNLLLSINF